MPDPIFKSAAPGTKLAGFEVLAEVGRGAASIIYCVKEPKTNQIWALKHVEKNNPKDQRFLDQAMREYEVATKCANPLIRGVDRVIKARTGLLAVKELFLVMEYIDGVPLEHNLPSTFEKALDVFSLAAEGLAHMHTCGYVHADIKPSNIIVNDDGGVKIIDLGQGCKVGDIKERIQGTPDYIAPEQVHRREITGHTDVYNLGATMYWCLTQQNIPTALGNDATLVDALDDSMIQHAEPVSKLNPRCPASLSDLIGECVQPKIKNRPEGGMREVYDRLLEIADDLTLGSSGEASGDVSD